MSVALSILDVIADPNILGDTLAPAQEAALRGLYGLPVPPDQEPLVRRCVGDAWRPGREYNEAAFICGRRSGKSDKLAANIAIYEAFFRSHRLSVGEKGVVLLLAQNMRQAKVVKGYIHGKIERSPVLRRHVVANRANELELDNGITIAIHPASFRAFRGLSVVCCICDEIAFWWTEDGYANPDTEVVRAARPAMATFPHAKLVLVSSPYTRSGVLWEAWQARNDEPDTLVWHAPTEIMNPTVPERFLAKERRRDPENFEREYEARFTEAISGFLPGESIDACVVRGRSSVDPVEGKRWYAGAIDAAFKGDRFTFCIAHRDYWKKRVVIDHLEGWQGSRRNPVQLSVVQPRIVEVCRRYRVRKLYADQYGAAPIAESFRRDGVRLEEVPFTNSSKADMYGTLRQQIVDREIELLEHPELLKELRQLELERLPGGSIRIGHPNRAGAHDDYADVVALATKHAFEKKVVGVHFGVA